MYTTIGKSKNYINYAITVDYKKAYYASPVDYENYLNELDKLGIKLDFYVYEVACNKYRDKLHLHGVISNFVNYKQLQQHGYHVLVKPIPLGQLERWIRYCMKDDPTRIEEYIIAHFWDMDKLDYNFDRKIRRRK